MPTPARARRLAPDHFRALAASGLRTPIGTDLVLHERPDPEAVRLDGKWLAGVVREAAERYRTPLAIPLMDLQVEKADLVSRLRPGSVEAGTFHFDSPPPRRTSTGPGKRKGQRSWPATGRTATPSPRSPPGRASLPSASASGRSR